MPTCDVFSLFREKCFPITKFGPSGKMIDRVVKSSKVSENKTFAFLAFFMASKTLIKIMKNKFKGSTVIEYNYASCCVNGHFDKCCSSQNCQTSGKIGTLAKVRPTLKHWTRFLTKIFKKIRIVVESQTCYAK